MAMLVWLPVLKFREFRNRCNIVEPLECGTMGKCWCRCCVVNSMPHQGTHEQRLPVTVCPLGARFVGGTCVICT